MAGCAGKKKHVQPRPFSRSPANKWIRLTCYATKEQPTPVCKKCTAYLRKHYTGQTDLTTQNRAMIAGFCAEVDFDICCAKCGKVGAKKICGRCGVVRYCSRECQVAHWKAGHKRECGSAAAADQSARPDGVRAEKLSLDAEPPSELSAAADKAAAAAAVAARAETRAVLYWSDLAAECVMLADAADGRRVAVAISGVVVYGLAVHGGYLYYSDASRGVLAPRRAQSAPDHTSSTLHRTATRRPNGD